jgi:hypothetical protein
LQTFAPVLSSQQLAAAIAPQLHADDLIVIHQEYEFASTLGFYLQRPSYARVEMRVPRPSSARAGSQPSPPTSLACRFLKKLCPPPPPVHNQSNPQKTKPLLPQNQAAGPPTKPFWVPHSCGLIA